MRVLLIAPNAKGTPEGPGSTRFGLETSMLLSRMSRSLSDWVAPVYALPSLLPETAWSGHIPFLFLLFKVARPSRFVELGVYNGGSFLAGCDAALQSETGTECIGIDTWQGDSHIGFYQGDQLFKGLTDRVAARYPSARLIRATFDEAAAQLDDESVDLLHIDGLHTYEAVKHDFETWSSKLAHRSIVLFHDTAVKDPGFGVWKFWAERVQAGEDWAFEFFHSHGLGVLVKGDWSGTELGPMMEFLGEPANAELFRIVCEVAGTTLAGRMERVRRTGRQDLEVPRVATPVPTGVGRNAPCPCGSGKKYKQCHGRGA